MNLNCTDVITFISKRGLHKYTLNTVYKIRNKPDKKKSPAAATAEGRGKERKQNEHLLC